MPQENFLILYCINMLPYDNAIDTLQCSPAVFLELFSVLYISLPQSSTCHSTFRRNVKNSAGFLDTCNGINC